MSTATGVALDELLDVANLERMIAEGMISRKESGDGRVLYDYTPRAQYTQTWNAETRTCRGLVTTTEGTVIGRPFAKFHNLAEHDRDGMAPIPAGPFEVTDKLDGSLVIAYPWRGGVGCNTRGSFASDQALAASRWLAAEEAAGRRLRIPVGQTWLFEWLAPDSRIVVDYSGRRELVLLAALDTATGADLPVPGDWRGSVVDRFDFDTLAAAAAFERAGVEGVVVRFASGLRVKIKQAEYVRLHRILTGVSARDSWEALAAGGSLDGYLDHVPDEFAQWVTGIAGDLRGRFDAIVAQARVDYAAVWAALDPDGRTRSTGRLDAATRKAFAERAAATAQPSVLFAMLDGKDHSGRVWRQLRPGAERPFREDDSG